MYAFMLNVVAGIIGRLELQENNALELAKLSECEGFLATNTGQIINVDNCFHTPCHTLQATMLIFFF